MWSWSFEKQLAEHDLLAPFLVLGLGLALVAYIIYRGRSSVRTPPVLNPKSEEIAAAREAVNHTSRIHQPDARDMDQYDLR